MHLCTGRTTPFRTKIPHIPHLQYPTRTAPRPPQSPLHPPTPHSQSMRHPLRVLKHRRTPGQVPQIARPGSRTRTSQATSPHSNPRRSSSRPMIHTLQIESNRMLRLLQMELDSTLGAPSVLAPIDPKMDRPHLHALGRHHLWCDKVNEKIISSIVLLVS